MTREIVSKAVSFALALSVTFSGTHVASATTEHEVQGSDFDLIAQEHNNNDDVSLEFLDDGGIIFRDGSEEIRGYYNESTGESTLVDSEGNEYYYPVFQNEENGNGIAFRDGGLRSFSCTMLLWAVDVVHGAAWSEAVKIISKAGWQGKALAAAMWALGSSGFLAAVSSKC